MVPMVGRISVRVFDFFVLDRLYYCPDNIHPHSSRGVIYKRYSPSQEAGRKVGVKMKKSFSIFPSRKYNKGS
jgi:hypothetical protein